VHHNRPEDERRMVGRVQEATIAAARAAFEPDERVLAAWLEGSLGTGEGDEWSDVDLHLAVADEVIAAFVDRPEALLGRIGEVVSWIDTPLPGGRLIPATIEVGGELARIDLVVQERSRVASWPRRAPGRFLFDRDAVARDQAGAPEPRFDAVPYLQGIMRTYFFGGMWPVRMTGRRDWSALLWNDATVIAQYIIPAMLIADGSPEFHRELTTRPRFLSAARTAQVRALESEMLRALSGIERDEVDVGRLARFHARLIAAVFVCFREACAAAGVEYPGASEAAYRRYAERELGIPIVP
jgi:predicted nucleotidyltransferase